MTIDEIETAFAELQLSQYFAQYQSLLRPAILMEATITDQAFPIGTSRFGGSPDLPEGTVWPVINDKLHRFIGQINLEELSGFAASSELPATGLLSFFYYNSFYFEEFDLFNDDGDENEDFIDTIKACCVLFTEDTKILIRTQSPTQEFRTATLAFREIVTPPDLNGNAIRTLFGQDEKRYRNSHSEYDFENLEDHQLLGYGIMDDHIANELAKRTGARSNLRLLLKLEWQMDLWQWGKGGTLFFMVPEQALRDKDFAQTVDYNSFV